MSLDDVVIPCELCDEPVWLSAYETHASSCARRHARPVSHESQQSQQSRDTILQQLLDITGPGGSLVVLGVPRGRQTYADAMHALHTMHGDEGEDEHEDEEEHEDETDADTTADQQHAERSEQDSDAQVSSLTALLGHRASLSVHRQPLAEVLSNSDLWTQLAQTLAASSPTHASTMSVTFNGEYERNTLLTEMMGGSHRIGVSCLESVTTVVDPTGDMCPICQDIAEGEIRETVCGHMFCGVCISTWLKSSKKCPVCMAELQPS